MNEMPRMFRVVPVSPEDEPEWFSKALCAQTDPEAFFPEKGGSTVNAKRICASCDVRQQCLEYAMAREERFGIWGGLSEHERRRLKQGIQPKPRRKPGRKPKVSVVLRPVLRHGTQTMWRKGCRTVGECPRGEDGLTCVQAHREYRVAAAERRRVREQQRGEAA